MAEIRHPILNAGGDPAQRELVTRTLQQAQYTVVEAADAEAVGWLLAERPALLVLHDDLPGGAADCCRRLKAAAGPPVLYVGPPSAVVPADGWLTPPVREAELVSLVRAALRAGAAERAQAAMAWQIHALLDSLKQGVCFLDPAGVVLRCNQAWADFAGRSVEDVVGRPVEELARGPGLARDPEFWRRLAGVGRRTREDCCHGERWFGVTAEPARNADGTPAGTVLTVTPFTPRSEPPEGPGEWDRELSALEQLGQPPIPVTARLFGLVPLREHVPTLYEELVRRYAELLDKAVEQRDFQVDHRLSESARLLAEQLGFMGAGPRDVIDVHNAALRRKRQGKPLESRQVFVEEGRFLVLELMGHLVSHYRKYSLGFARTR